MKVFVIKETVCRSFDDDRIEDELSRHYCFGYLAFDMLKDARNFLLSLGCSAMYDDGEVSDYHFKKDIYNSNTTSIVAYYEVLELNRILSLD